MDVKSGLSREVFLNRAGAAGLNTDDPHMEALYAHLQRVLPSLQAIWELDVTDAEPVTPLISGKEGAR
jgi:Asp-tRNA(Asn)/Glu-tRNA(Gln) amidotransferase C subunit